MSGGIRTGTRAEQLTDLRRQTRVQIEYARYEGRDTTRLERLAARIDEELGIEAAKPQLVVHEKPPGNAVDQLLHDLGATTKDVRTWAIANGLLDGVHRGRIALTIVQAYATHSHLSELIESGYVRRTNGAHQ